MNSGSPATRWVRPFGRVARAVLAAQGGDHDQVVEADVLVHRAGRQFQHVGETLVPVLQVQGLVEHADALRQVVDDGQQVGRLALQLLRQQLLAGDVLHCAHHPPGLAVYVLLDAEAVVEVADRAGSADDAVVEIATLALAVGAGQRLAHLLAIVGMDPLEEGLAGRCHALGDAEQLAGAVGPPQLAGDQVALPAAQACHLHGLDQVVAQSLKLLAVALLLAQPAAGDAALVAPDARQGDGGGDQQQQADRCRAEELLARSRQQLLLVHLAQQQPARLLDLRGGGKDEGALAVVLPLAVQIAAQRGGRHRRRILARHLQRRGVRRPEAGGQHQPQAVRGAFEEQGLARLGDARRPLQQGDQVVVRRHAQHHGVDLPVLAGQRDRYDQVEIDLSGRVALQ